MSFRTESRIDQFILPSTWQQGKWLSRGLWFSIYGFPIWSSARETSLQCCLPAYLLVTSRLLVLLGGLNLFTEERLRYFHVFIPSLQHIYDLRVGNMVQPKVWGSWGKKKLLQVWLEQFFQILPESQKMKSVLLVTVLTKCYNSQNISRGKNR